MKAAIAAAAMILTLAACTASPPLRYHTLSRMPASSPAAWQNNAAVLVEVLPVAIPERINREQLVLSGPGQQLEVQDGERWAAPLDDELRQVIDDALWRRLSAADIYAAPPPTGTGLPHYRLAVRLERLNASAGANAVVEGSWTIRRLPQGDMAVCRAGFVSAPQGSDIDASVAALAAGTAQLADAIAASLERLHRHEGAPCAP